MPETETAGYHIVRSFLPAQTRVILKPSLWQDKWRVDGPLSFCHNRLRSDTRENRKNWSKKSIGKSQKKIIEEKDNFCFKKFVWLSGRFYMCSCYSLGLPCIFIIGDGRTLTMGGGKAGRYVGLLFLWLTGEVVRSDICPVVCVKCQMSCGNSTGSLWHFTISKQIRTKYKILTFFTEVTHFSSDVL